MQLRILGPVEVVGDDGDLLMLGGPQRRLVLALLLSRVGQVCSLGMLAEALWGDDAPPASTTVLHAQVSRLRKLLEPDRPPRSPPRVLQLVEGGYRIDLTGHEFDADRFNALVDEGLAAARSGDAARGQQRLAEALELWRGPAFGDLGTHPLLFVAAAELDERRALAREGLFDSGLQLGQHAELVAGLEATVGEFPYRERFWAQLMLALYRAGRQADALAAYKRCRRQLIDELGIEPGSDLQALEEAVLLQKSELDWEPASEATPAAVPDRIRRTPVPRTTFVGRQAETREVIDALQTHRLVTITGPGGVGKTRLAIEVAGAVADLFRHGIAFCELVTVTASDLVLAAVADAVGFHEPGGAADQPLVEQLADRLVNREMVLVIDNADQLVVPVADVVDHLLDRCPRLRVLVTSREPLRMRGECIVRLRPLSSDGVHADSARLFVDRAALANPRAELDADTVIELCRRLDGLPLAIELAASRLRSIPLQHLATSVDERASDEAGNRPVGTTAYGVLQGVVDWSIESLPADQQALLRRLAVFAGGCTAEAVAAVTGLDTDPVVALAELIDRSLVQLDTGSGSPRYRLLETIRSDGLRRLADHGERDGYHGRHLDWCLSLTPTELAHGEDPAVVEPLGVEIENVIAALAWSLAGGDVAAGSRLAIAAACFWMHAGRFHDARAWLERAAAATEDSPQQRVTTLRWLGWVLARQSDLSAARDALEEAIRSAATDDADRAAGGPLAADAEILLAGVEIESGDLPAGERRLRQLAERPDVLAEPWRRALISHGLGRRALAAGELPLASELLEQAVTESRAANMWYTLAQGLASVSQVEAGRRRLPRAEGAFAEALSVTRRHRLLGLMPRVLGAGAVLAFRSGDWSLGRSRLDESLAAARLAGDLRAEVATLTNLGAVEQNEGRPMNAIEHLEEALVLADKIDDDRIALRVLPNLAESVLAGTHDTGRALALSAEALTRARPMGLRISEVTAIESAALALIERSAAGDVERAALLLGAAAAERDRLDYPLDADADSPVTVARSTIAHMLGDAVADESHAAGTRIGLDTLGDELLADVAASPDAGPA